MSERLSKSLSANIPKIYIDWQRGEVGTRADTVVVLRAQSLLVLKALHENAGHVMGKDQLMAKVWPDVAVTDDSLVQCITEIRRALDDSCHIIIKTLPKRGYLFEAQTAVAGPVTSASGLPVHGSMRSRFWWGVAAGAVIAGLALTAFTFRPTPQPAILPTIAVLPFANFGGDPQGDRYANMMTEDVITDLSHSKDFAVIARNSTGVYKGKAVDIREVGKALGVDYVLEGSLEALPGRLRATAKLIDAKTNTHIWSERFEGQGDDFFTVEAEITNRIATSVLGHDAVAVDNVRSLIRRKPSQQWGAYDAYQAGLEASHQMSAAYIKTADEMFAKSLAIDPGFARAHVGLAWNNFLKILFGEDKDGTAFETMLSEAKLGVELDPNDGEAHAVLAQAYALQHDQNKMLIEAQKALKLAPANADILVITGMFLVQAGQSDTAVKNVEKALKLNPNYPYWYTTSLYATYFYAGKYERSMFFAKEAAKAAPVNNDFLAMNAAYLNQNDELATAKQALMAIDPQWSAERLLTVFGALQGSQELERLVTGAQKAGLRVCMTNQELAATPNAVRIAHCDVGGMRI
ncbi:MAG: winged helix-turn-helix domain-containing protein [Alphaproteobacteria bacterium]|nr:winged helix-turn-helix domain-containing protein [Alphaproteobacteria bacterium]